MDGYRIADEPRPSGLAQYAVNPMWPLFAIMFAGSWISWPWFILNGIAVGSPTLRKEIGLAVGGFLGSATLVFAIMVGADTGILTRDILPYVWLLLVVWKLVISYWLQIVQSRTFEIYEYYGGAVRNGLWIVMFAGVFGRRVLAQLFETNVLLALVLS